jgi:hypothetical protein
MNICLDVSYLVEVISINDAEKKLFMCTYDAKKSLHTHDHIHLLFFF